MIEIMKKYISACVFTRRNVLYIFRICSIFKLHCTVLGSLECAISHPLYTFCAMNTKPIVMVTGMIRSGKTTAVPHWSALPPSLPPSLSHTHNYTPHYITTPNHTKPNQTKPLLLGFISGPSHFLLPRKRVHFLHLNGSEHVLFAQSSKLV